MVSGHGERKVSGVPCAELAGIIARSDNLPNKSGAVSGALGQLDRRAATKAGRRWPVNRGPHAALVWFYADPDAVMGALSGGQLPPVGPPSHAVLFAPGIKSLFRVATEVEAALWATLSAADASPAVVSALLMEGALAYPT
jgi:hypothetical protein